MKEQQKLLLEACVQKLKNSSLRITTQRLEVLKCLLSAPASISEIIQKLSAKNKAVDRVTVYRIVENFSELGLVHLLLPNSQYALCSHALCSHEQHILVRCKSCGDLEEYDVPEKIFKPLAEYLKRISGFKAAPSHFQLDGICKACVH